MLHHHRLVVSLCAGLVLSAGLVTYAEQADPPDAAPTSQTLLLQGIQQAERGNADAARATLRRVDPNDLPAEQRVRLTRVLRSLDTASQAQSADDKLKQAGEARKIGDVVTVKISIKDKATLDNNSKRSRDAKSGCFNIFSTAA